MIIMPALVLCFQSATGSELSLIPKPLEIYRTSGSYRILPETGVQLDWTNSDLVRIAGFLHDFLLEYYHGSLSREGGNSGTIRFLIDPDVPGGAEAYRLKIDEKGIFITSPANNGIFYGLQTLRQLFERDSLPGVLVPFVEIYDKPRFSWRGLHLDVGRHFFPPFYIKKYIDHLAMYKLNTFHWHLTEDQGWRIEIKKYPLLTDIASWRDETIVPATYRHKGVSGPVPVFDGIGNGGFYTQDQIREIVRYAAERYVTIVPEIELPGHSSAALAAYPWLGCTGGPYEVQKTWGIFDDVYCAGKEETFRFLEDVLDEVCDLFPSPWVHIGGDECPKTRWKACPLCQNRIKTEGLLSEVELQRYFVHRIESYLASRHKQMVGWEEIQESGLSGNAIVMAWKNLGTRGIEAARSGHPVVVCPTAYCYLNIYQTRGSEINPGDYRTDGKEPVAFRGYIPLEKIYGFEPVPAELEPEAAAYIIGSQANLWTEFISDIPTLEYMLFPRLGALAEVVWTEKTRRDYPEFRKRLDKEFRRLAMYGINYCDHPDETAGF